MTARRPSPVARAPWDRQATSGEIRTLEAEVAALRESLRRPPARDDDARHAESARRTLVGQVESLESQRVALAARRESLRTAFDAAMRAGLRRDARLRALGQVLALVLLAILAPRLADVLLSDVPVEPGAGGAPGVALLLLATVGLAARLRRG
ncbi:MAG: hypothetical protein AB1730_26310 [Myxococcota bacterium]|jgi:hypothetical protein